MKRGMSLAVKPGKSLRRALRRIARQELGKASERLLKPDRQDDDVHEARKSIKKAEAVATLLDGVGGRVSAKDMNDLRTAKRALSRLRDADAAIQTFDHLQSRFPDRIPTRLSTTIQAR